MRVRFTPYARQQLRATLEYIKHENPGAALRFRQRAERGLRRLERFPHSGRVLPEFPKLPYREIIILPYRFFYRVAKGTVWIVGVWHGAQIPKVPGRDK